MWGSLEAAAEFLSAGDASGFMVRALCSPLFSSKCQRIDALGGLAFIGPQQEEVIPWK